VSDTKTKPKTRKRTTAKKRSAAPRSDMYQVVTDQVVALLEAGTIPWRKPWDPTIGLPRSSATGKAYRGINLLILGLTAQAHGYKSQYWGTYPGLQKLGAQVRGPRTMEDGTVVRQTGTEIIKWVWLTKGDTDPETGETVTKSFPIMRSWKVFNIDQCDPIEEGGTIKVPTSVAFADHTPLEEAEAVVADYIKRGPALTMGFDGAWYAPQLDQIGMPEMGTFDTVEEYYSTIFHEMTHSTGHPSRLKRDGVADLVNHRHGSPLYAKEELVAEMGAAMLSGVVGTEHVTLDNSAAYLANWLQVLKGDKKLVVQAAGQAQKAVDLILGTTFEEEEVA
jgi:antirestriction protein ArdC